LTPAVLLPHAWSESRSASKRLDPLLIVALAMALRVLFCFAVYPRIADRFGPGDGYDVIALNLVHGKGYVLGSAPAASERLPLYPALLAISFVLFGPSPWPWQLAQCVCGAATCALVLSMARRYASRAGAVAAAVVCAAHPTLILYAARPLTETLYILLLLLFVRALSAAPWRGWKVGLLFGLQLLTKATAFLHVPAFVVAGWRARRGAMVAAGMWTVATLLPWTLWNLRTSGHPNLLSATAGHTLYHGVYISQRVGWTIPVGELNRNAELALWRESAQRGVPDDADVLWRDRVAAELARAWIADHPAEAVRLWTRNLVLTWYLGRSRLSMAVHAVLHGVLLVAATLGAIRMWRAHGHARDVMIAAALLIAGYTAFHAVVQPAVRYILPAVPLAALLAAASVRAESRA
jgi:4-amino-4-deoxy-L-arabinose transferase-like glycosyltransferase